MKLFNLKKPIFKRKSLKLAEDNTGKSIYIQIKIRDKTLFYNIYTCIDQVLVIWGLITALIFITANFAPISWIIQGIVWSILSVIGILVMIFMTHKWAKTYGFLSLLYGWAILMLVGIILSDGGIFWGWSWILSYLPHLWLGLSAVGYLLTSIVMKSRTFLVGGIIHLLGIGLLPLIPSWQFLATGLIITVNLFIFAEIQWDDVGSY